MTNRTEKDFWIEMSIREVWTQAHFADLAYQNIRPKVMVGTDATFSSIHSFLSHCTNVSKMLVADDGETSPKTIGDILGISKNSTIHNRTFRNHLEHYDERLKEWIRKRGVNVSIGAYNIMPESKLRGSDMVFVTHYDPTNNMFTFVDEDFDLSVLYNEVIKIKSLADNWVKTILNQGVGGTH